MKKILFLIEIRPVIHLMDVIQLIRDNLYFISSLVYIGIVIIFTYIDKVSRSIQEKRGYIIKSTKIANAQ